MSPPATTEQPSATSTSAGSVTAASQPEQRLMELGQRFLHVWYGASVQDWEETASETRFVEYMDGKLVVHSPISLGHSRLVVFINALLHNFVSQHRLGEVLLGPFTMDLGFARKFEPDIMFVSSGRAASLGEDRLSGPANLVIEIASPSTKAYDRDEKRKYYAEGKVDEYWMIDPVSRLVNVDRPAGQRVTELSRGKVESQACPGWWIMAEWLWEYPLPDPLSCYREITKATG